VLGILIVDHGSRRAAANAALESIAELVRERAGPDVVVRVAHLEIARPTIEEGLRACVEGGARQVLVQPYMLTEGRHATVDVPRLVAEAAQRLGVAARVTAPLGVHPLLADLVLERCGVRAAPK
jgi:sirohydrochlorin ferrochelatase